MRENPVASAIKLHKSLISSGFELVHIGYNPWQATYDIWEAENELELDAMIRAHAKEIYLLRFIPERLWDDLARLHPNPSSEMVHKLVHEMGLARDNKNGN
jgi:hypothetical protein